MTAGVLAARIGIVAAGVIGGSLASARVHGLAELPLALLDVAVVVAFAVAAAVAVPHAPGMAVFSAATAACWAIGAVAPVAVYWHRGTLIALIFAAPRLWPRAPAARVIVAVGLAVSLVPAAWSTDAAALVLAVGIAVAAVLRRRSLGPLLVAVALVLAAACALGPVASFASGALVTELVEGLPAQDLRFGAYCLALVAVAVLVAVDAARRRALDLVDAVVRIAPSDGDLRSRMADAVGDASLRLAWWDDARGAYVADGEPVVEAPADARATALHVTTNGAPVARVVCRADVAADPAIRDALVRAARLAGEARSLDAEYAIRVDEIARSSERLLRAADAERADARALLDADVAGPLDRLAVELGAASIAAGPASDSLRWSAELMERCRRQLEEVSAGLPPSELKDGLEPALIASTLHSPVPVTVRVDEDVRGRDAVNTLYFACAEAISNAFKHSRASRVDVVVRLDRAARVVVATIDDDGAGGAVAALAGGLAGIRDRALVLGGTATVHSPLGDGTRIEILVPWDADAGVRLVTT